MTIDDVARLALALPETSEGTSYGNRAWKVHDKGFVWERPLSRKDTEALGEAAPAVPPLAAYVEHLGAKDALLADPSGVFFTSPHFDGHPSILVHLDRVDAATLEEVVTEAWLCRAPDALAARWLTEHRA